MTDAERLNDLLLRWQDMRLAGANPTPEELPRRARELGYVFKFPDIDGALRDVLAIG